MEFRYGVSFISIQQARQNLREEIPDWSFDRIRDRAREGWDEVLGRIQVEGGTPAQRKVFYTALYWTAYGRGDKKTFLEKWNLLNDLMPFRKMIFALLFLSVFSLSAGQFTVPVIRCADEIIKRQTSDGAIVMNGIRATNEVSPYFGNLAAIGLVRAAQATGNGRYLLAAERWAGWYAKSMNPNGTVCDYIGAPAAWRSTGNFESTDSYAATFLELLEAIGRQDNIWARAHYDAAARAIAAIRLTLRPDGLTLAKPGWPIAYTMDNVETARGLRAAARLAAGTGHPVDAVAWSRAASRMESAIGANLWDDRQNDYCIGLQSSGQQIMAPDGWYPGLMADLMAIGLGPDSTRNRKLYERLLVGHVAAIPSKAATEADLEHLVWWGYAARTAGDTPRFEEIQMELATVNPRHLYIGNTALLGHVDRLLAEQRAD